MGFKEKIQQDLNEKLKKGEKVSSSVLRLLLAVILNKEKEKRYKLSKERPELTDSELNRESKLTDEEIIEVISSEIKKRKEAILEFERGLRRDLAEKERGEKEILERYLPEQLPKNEIKKLAQKIIEKINASELKDMGKVMAELMPSLKGRAEGSVVSQIVKELLTSKK